MKNILIILSLFTSYFCSAQSIGYLRYDTTVLQKVGGNNELKILNATRGVTGGVLTNMGNGRTSFVTPSGSTNTSIGSGFRIAVNGTNNIKSFTATNGLTADSLTAGQVGVKLGGRLTESTTIDADGLDFNVTNSSIINLISNANAQGVRLTNNFGGNTYQVAAGDGYASLSGLQDANAANNSEIQVSQSQINVSPHLGNLFIDSLLQSSSSSDSVLVKEVGTGQIKTRAQSAIGGGSGLTVGTTPITSGTANRLFYQTSGNVLGQITTTSTGSDLLVNTTSATDPITGNGIFAAVDGSMRLSFRDHSSGQGYLSISNGTMTGYLGQTNATQGITTGSYTAHPVTIVQQNSPAMTFDVSKHVGVYTVTSPSALFHLPAGSATATYAPLKFTEGVRNTTAEDGAMEKDDAFYLTKTNAVRYGVGGTLNSQFTDVGNVGTGEDDLMSYTIPAGTLSQDGDFIEFQMSFLLTTANLKTLKIHFGSQSLTFYSLTSTAQPILRGTITRRSATQQVWSIISTTAGVQDYSDLVIGSQTLSGAIIIKATGEGVATNDIQQRQMNVKFFPAN